MSFITPSMYSETESQIWDVSLFAGSTSSLAPALPKQPETRSCRCEMMSKRWLLVSPVAGLAT